MPRFVLLLYATPVTLLLSFNKKGPGGYLIRADLIRFPGSIPGAMQDDSAPTDIF